jgi:hypothetical protein
MSLAHFRSNYAAVLAAPVRPAFDLNRGTEKIPV